MERLTDDRTAEALRVNIEKLRAAGFAIDPSDERYVRLAEYERSGLEPEEISQTADVEPDRHGHWINGNCGDYVCSVCGWAFSDELPYMARKYDAETEEIMRYCMHCGAKMDKEEEKK